ncbi:MAG: hypothetical protein IJ809_03595 [Clostridia bacterium]|nr:hypothetical protein [Clostridia bacterium]
MGRTYTVPRSVKGESRILYVFTVVGLIFTVAFGLVGFFIKTLLGGLLPGYSGWIVVGVFAAIGFVVGTLKIPDSNVVGPLKKAGGEKILDIVIRSITFMKRKKIYIYRYNEFDKGEKK